MLRTVAPVKLIALICLVMVLGLLRAERGVSELQGRVGEPSRLLHIANDRQGVWHFSVLGFQYTVSTAIVVVKRDQPLLELPVDFPWAQMDWQALTRSALEWIQSCLREVCRPFPVFDEPQQMPKGRPV